MFTCYHMLVCKNTHTFVVHRSMCTACNICFVFLLYRGACADPSVAYSGVCTVLNSLIWFSCLFFRGACTEAPPPAEASYGLRAVKPGRQPKLGHLWWCKATGGSDPQGRTVKTDGREDGGTGGGDDCVWIENFNKEKKI